MPGVTWVESLNRQIEMTCSDIVVITVYNVYAYISLVKLV